MANTKKYLDVISKKKKIPTDWCYIYNFSNPNEPIAVSLPAGHGKEFKETMDQFIKDIRNDINSTFSNEDFEKEKNTIRQKFEQKRTDLLEKLNKELEATILMVTHDAFTASYAHRILFIKDGKIFNELVRGNDSRKEFFNKIIEVVTLLGGDTLDVL